MKVEKVKYKIMAAVIVLSVLLSYVCIFIVDSYAYSGASSLVQFGTVSADMRNESGKVVRGDATMYVTSSWLSNYDLVKDLCLAVDSYVDSSTGLTRYNISVNMNGVKDNDKETHSYLQTQYESLADCNDFGSVLGAYSYISSVYVFKDRTAARSYLSGNMSESELIQNALNYNDVMFGSASYDASVPAPDKLYINSLSSSAVNSVWQYTDTTVDLSNVTYKVEVENFYMSSSLFNSIAKGYTGKNGESSWKFNGTIDACNRLKGMSTVETYLSAPTQLLADQVLVSGEVMTDSGVMHTTNTYICKPTDYSGRFASSGNAFFTGASNSHWVEYCGSQITVTPYAEVDGVMKKGSTCVARRFTNDILNGLVGSTYTKIAEDPEGGEYIESTNKQDSSGNESDTIGSLDDSNILQHVKKGFGLAGSDGYIALAKQFFVGVPDSIWILIGMALAVSIAVIVFKALRGM